MQYWTAKRQRPWSGQESQSSQAYEVESLCLRGLRITVWDLLGWLGAGMSEEAILDEHHDIEKADFAAVY